MEKKFSEKGKIIHDFDSVSIGIASPEDILEWSYGEVTGAETINYRTHRPERGGLFDEKIFGPEKDFNCFCGKYSGIQYKGFICDKCGVEITRSSVRRERMGHIELACPVAHIWYLGKNPCRVALLLGLPAINIKKVIYFSAYIITKVDEKKKKEVKKVIENEYETKTENIHSIKTKKMFKEEYTLRIKELDKITVNNIITENEYHKLNQNFKNLFEAAIGSEAILDLLKKINLKKLEKDTIKEIEVATEIKSERLNKQLSLVRNFIKTKQKPEWMFMIRIAVTPPGTRPMVPLDGGRYASSDLNDLYRRVIYRNIRLRRLQDILAPEIILRNEKRLLQEAVDSLIDSPVKSGARASNITAKTKQLKSLAEYLKGKKGFFRSSLLGKSVDYSARSVIVIGPELKIDECGLPKIMALELFRPFVIAELLKRELAFNISFAGKMIDEQTDVIWEILDKITENKYVLLNRQPTLHRQGIQAFKPVLVEGKAIKVHPLICSAFNADFDGDQMAVHLPLSEEAQMEAKEILLSTKNMIDPATGDITTIPAQDIILGFYFATSLGDTTKNQRMFLTANEALSAYDYGLISLRTPITLFPSERKRYEHFKGKPFTTSVGRILFNNLLIEDDPFINESITKKIISDLINSIVEKHGIEVLAESLDKMKEFGFKYVTKSGITFAFSCLGTPTGRIKKIEEASKQSLEVDKYYKDGLISKPERIRKKVEIWQNAKGEMQTKVQDILSKENDLHYIIDSGSRGDIGNANMLMGMFGIVESSSGIPIEEPIVSSLALGLSSIEFFNASFGGRKGLVDIALKTANAGYLSRQLFDVAQEVTVINKDCKSKEGFVTYKQTSSGLNISFSKRIKGRFVAEDVVDKKGNVIVKKNNIITKEISHQIESQKEIEHVKIRSPITCKNVKGICQKCYGEDVTTKNIVDIGEPIGTIAAQSIGEPGTQLTMRTFHGGGATSSSGDITTGLPRIIQIFGKRKPKVPAILSPIEGVITGIELNSENKTIVVTNPNVKDQTVELGIPFQRHIIVKKNQTVAKGQFLTDGEASLDELFEYTDKIQTQQYIMSEVTKIYEIQGIELLPVHLEILINQLFSRVKVTDPGDSTYTVGDILEKEEACKINFNLKEASKKLLDWKEMIYGIINISITRSNFLSAASFQDTNNVLINASLRGATDVLSGLKENVIIGRLIPAGTGFEGSNKKKLLQKILDRQMLDAEES